MGKTINLNAAQALALRRRLGLRADASPTEVQRHLQVTTPVAAAKPAAPKLTPAEGAARDRIVAQASAERRIGTSAAQRAEWRARYDRDPETTHRLLTAPDDQGGLVAALPPASAAAAAEAEEPSLLDEMRRQQATSMVWANAGSQPPAGREPVRAASAATASGSRPQVVRDGAGNLTYAGYAVKLNSAGQACVFADTNGHTQWVPVEEFERANLGLAALEAAGHFGSMLPTGQQFNEGPA